jgi:hypothetical protein
LLKNISFLLNRNRLIENILTDSRSLLLFLDCSSGDEELTANISLTYVLALPVEQRQRATASGIRSSRSLLLFLDCSSGDEELTANISLT